MSEQLIDTRQLQDKLLEILLYFDGYCRENGLKYYLCGGCLIGVVRHKGFIPWDDDVDLFMPREDYERLARIWDDTGDKEHYAFCRTDREHNYHHGGASIRDIHTTEINRHSVNEDICHGIAIDIMPIDGCPKSKIARAVQLYNAALFNLFNFQRLPDNKGKLVRGVSKCIFALYKSPERRYKLWKKAEKRMSRYAWKDCEEVTELIGALHGMVLRHKKEDFENVVYREFEGHQLPVMAGYETYLRRIWGDYMQLPPVEKRVAKHDSIYTSTTEPYTQFKGKLYCVKE